jgi:hypothetical protein
MLLLLLLLLLLLFICRLVGPLCNFASIVLPNLCCSERRSQPVVASSAINRWTVIHWVLVGSTA